VSSLEQVSNSIASILDSSIDPYSEIMSLMIVERWDNRYGKFSIVSPTEEDMFHYKKWCELNVSSHRRLKGVIQDIQEIFFGMPLTDILEGLYRYY